MPTFPDLQLVRGLAAALLVGALVGIEREKSKGLAEHVGIGGVRTFMLFALVGAVAAWLARELDAPAIFVTTVLGVTALAVAGYVVQARTKPDAVGLTTEMAAVAVCLLGGACVVGPLGVAVALGVAVSAVLAYKQSLHDLVARLGTEDIEAGVKLLAATFIVLPLLPREAVDPWGAIEPYSVWLLAILIAGLSLVGYVATRALGPDRGAAVTGLAGGLVSSTAVTLAFARRSRAEGGKADTVLAVGLLLAWTIMFPRMAVVVAVVHPQLVAPLLAPLGAMATVALAIAAVFLFQARAAGGRFAGGVPLRNPFSLTEAFRFALLFAAVLLVVKLAEQRFPASGYYVVSALAGLTDVDAITLSISRLARDGSADTHTAVVSIVLAALANTMLKCGVIVTIAGRSLRGKTVLATAALLAAGLAAVLLG